MELMAVDVFKDILPSILMTKKDCLIDDNEKDYVPFIVNKALSFHYDCILHSNNMNMYPELDKKLQFHYYINSIRSYKRPFTKWLKRKTISDLEILKEYYDCSNEKAKEILTVLTKDHLVEIRSRLDKGGFDAGHKRTY